MRITINYSPSVYQNIDYFGQLLKIGRQSECDIHFDDNFISRKHAILYTDEDGSLWIKDGFLFGANSKFGVYIDGARTTRAQIKNGNIISFCREKTYPNLVFKGSEKEQQEITESHHT